MTLLHQCGSNQRRNSTNFLDDPAFHLTSARTRTRTSPLPTLLDGGAVAFA